MSGLRAAILADAFELPRGRNTAQPTRLRRAVDNLPEPTGTRVTTFELGEIQKRICAAANQRAFQRITRRELREGARGCLSEPLPFGRETAIREAFLKEVARRGQRSAIIALIGAYLGQFQTDDIAVLRFGAWLEENCDGIWRERAGSWLLFKPTAGPQLLVERLLAEKDPHSILSTAGLDRDRVFGGYGEAAFLLACRNIVHLPIPQLQTVQARLILWARRNARFGYDKLWPDFAKALLEPWTKTEAENSLSADHKTRLINELMAYGGDPRTGSKSKWGMLDGTSAKLVLLRWLTRASVLQFLDIVDRTAEARMWSYRRAFWTSYLLANHIDAAWVAFGSSGARLATDAARRAGDESLNQYGRIQRGTGRGSDYSALIMRIGDLTISDWSHNGKYNLWRHGGGGAPELFLPQYSGDRLSHGPVTGSHWNPEGFLWQRRLAQEIAEHTGRRVSSDQWFPAGRR